ncbi:hypothetical protein BU17DRAFT_83409 [Hysterangium stoloniferum]|nr:hypothetical protein BU17DRAFT_83409 [Hysterangium stoloniferum]
MPQSNIPSSSVVRATALAASSNSPLTTETLYCGTWTASFFLAVNTPVPPGNMSRDLKKDDFGDNLFSEPQELKLHTAFFSHVPIENDDDDDDDENPADVEEEGEGQGTSLRRQETMGKTAITLSRLSTSPSQTSSPNRSAGGLHRGSPRHSPSNPRLRAQSTYGIPGSSSVFLTGTPATRSPTDESSSGGSRALAQDNDGKGSWKSRSRSIDRFNVGPSSEGTRNFMDPLVIRKKEKTAARNSVVLSPGGPRGRVADLLAFFDADKQQ